MKKWWWWLPLLIVLALAGYVVGGPYLAIRGISQAVANRDTAQLARHVDFPTLRVNLKAQLTTTWCARPAAACNRACWVVLHCSLPAVSAAPVWIRW